MHTAFKPSGEVSGQLFSSESLEVLRWRDLRGAGGTSEAIVFADHLVSAAGRNPKDEES